MRTSSWHQLIVVFLFGAVVGAVGVLIAVRGDLARDEPATAAPTMAADGTPVPATVVQGRPGGTTPPPTAPATPVMTGTAPVTVQRMTSAPAGAGCDGDCWAVDEGARRLTWTGPTDGTADIWQRAGTPSQQRMQEGWIAVFMAAVPMRVELCVGTINGRLIAPACEPDLINVAPGRYEIVSQGPRGGFRATRQPTATLATCPEYRPTTAGQSVVMDIDVPEGELAFVDAWAFDTVSSGVFVRIRGPYQGRHTIADGSYCGGIDGRKNYAPLEQQRRSYFKAPYREMTCARGRCALRPEGTTDFSSALASATPATMTTSGAPVVLSGAPTPFTGATPAPCPTAAEVGRLAGLTVERLDSERCAFVGSLAVRGAARCPPDFLCTFALGASGVVLIGADQTREIYRGTWRYGPANPGLTPCALLRDEQDYARPSGFPIEADGFPCP